MKLSQALIWGLVEYGQSQRLPEGARGKPCAGRDACTVAPFSARPHMRQADYLANRNGSCWRRLVQEPDTWLGQQYPIEQFNPIVVLGIWIFL